MALCPPGPRLLGNLLDGVGINDNSFCSRVCRRDLSEQAIQLHSTKLTAIPLQAK